MPNRDRSNADGLLSTHGPPKKRPLTQALCDGHLTSGQYLSYYRRCAAVCKDERTENRGIPRVRNARRDQTVGTSCSFRIQGLLWVSWPNGRPFDFCIVSCDNTTEWRPDVAVPVKRVVEHRVALLGVRLDGSSRGVFPRTGVRLVVDRVTDPIQVVASAVSLSSARKDSVRGRLRLGRGGRIWGAVFATSSCERPRAPGPRPIPVNCVPADVGGSAPGIPAQDRAMRSGLGRPGLLQDA